jgi:hypothetical protein
MCVFVRVRFCRVRIYDSAVLSWNRVSYVLGPLLVHILIEVEQIKHTQILKYLEILQ